DEKTEANREVRHHQRRKQQGLERPLETELVALERERERRADRERDGGRPAGHDEPVVEAGLKVFVRDRLDEPAPRPALGRERQNRPAVESGQDYHQSRQQQKAENGAYDGATQQGEAPLRRQARPLSSGRFFRAGRRRGASGPAPGI